MSASSKSPKTSRNILLGIFGAIVLCIALYAWNCSDYSVPGDSPTIILFGIVDPRLELYADVIVEHAVPRKRFCPHYHFSNYVDNPGHIERKGSRYRAVIRVGVPRFALFCDWKVSDVSLKAKMDNKGTDYVFSDRPEYDTENYEAVKEVVCYSEKYAIDCDALYMKLEDAFRGEHELNIRLVDTRRPKN